MPKERPAETPSIGSRGIAASYLVTRHYPLFPSFFALLFVMFKRRFQTANHFRSGFEERLRFRFIDFVNVASHMFDQFAKFLPNIGGMSPRGFRCNCFHMMRSLVGLRADASDLRILLTFSFFLLT